MDGMSWWNGKERDSWGRGGGKRGSRYESNAIRAFHDLTRTLPLVSPQLTNTPFPPLANRQLAMLCNTNQETPFSDLSGAIRPHDRNILASGTSSGTGNALHALAATELGIANRCAAATTGLKGLNLSTIHGMLGHDVSSSLPIERDQGRLGQEQAMTQICTRREPSTLNQRQQRPLETRRDPHLRASSRTCCSRTRSEPSVCLAKGTHTSDIMVWFNLQYGRTQRVCLARQISRL